MVTIFGPLLGVALASVKPGAFPALSETSHLARRSLLSTFAASSFALVAEPQPSNAAAGSQNDVAVANKLQRIYDEGAATYDAVYSNSMVSKALDFPKLRSDLLSMASGDVLELGVGTGLNLQYYGTTTPMTTYSALDISPKMLQQAKDRISGRQVAPSLDRLSRQGKVQFYIGDVNNLSKTFQGKQFDTIIDTFSLCVFPDPLRALKEVRNVLNPGGKVLLLEHQDSLLGNALDPTRNVADVIGTCRYDDDVLGLLKAAGFDNVSYKSYAGGFLIQVIAKMD